MGRGTPPKVPPQKVYTFRWKLIYLCHDMYIPFEGNLYTYFLPLLPRWEQKAVYSVHFTTFERETSGICWRNPNAEQK